MNKFPKNDTDNNNMSAQIFDTAHQKVFISHLAIAGIVDTHQRVGGKLKHCVCTLLGCINDDGWRNPDSQLNPATKKNKNGDVGQRPWEVLRERNLSIEEVRAFLQKSRDDLTTSIFIPHRFAQRKTSVARNKPSCPDHILDSLQDLCRRLQDEKVAGVLNNKQPAETATIFKKFLIKGLVQLLPLYLSYVDFGIKAFLTDNLILQFHSQMGGVVVTFRKAKPVDDQAFSVDADPFGALLFIINVEVLVFSPAPGHVLVGTITGIQEEGVNCLVLGIWQAKITKANLPEGSSIVPAEKLTDDEKQKLNSASVPLDMVVTLPQRSRSNDAKKRKTDRTVMARNSAVRFRVLRVFSQGGYKTEFSIEGSMRI